jgi:Glycosyltransferase Family 4
MKILLLAPEPFYQDRGTPIAVSLVLRVLSERGDDVHVLTYHEGRNVEFQHVTVHRTTKLHFIRNIRPGFSWKKVICDVFMFFKAARLVSKNHYDLIYAVEESVFIALAWKWILGIPYVYDMDSSLVQQMIEQHPFLNRFRALLTFFEDLAVRNAKGVATVCDALAGPLQRYKGQRVVVLQDISLLSASQEDEK